MTDDNSLLHLADHGTPRAKTVEQGLKQARAVLKDLSRVGIDLEKVTWQLENEGVQKFIDPFDELQASLAEKQTACRA